MEYIIIFILQAIGVAFRAYQKISELDKQFTEIPKSEIINKFLKKERFTYYGNAIILLFQIVCHLIVDLYYPKFRDTEIPLFIADWSVPYIIGSFIVAFFLGYFGQWLVYRIFGKAEKYLADKTE